MQHVLNEPLSSTVHINNKIESNLKLIFDSCTYVISASLTYVNAPSRGASSPNPRTIIKIGNQNNCNII